MSLQHLPSPVSFTSPLKLFQLIDTCTQFWLLHYNMNPVIFLLPWTTFSIKKHTRYPSRYSTHIPLPRTGPHALPIQLCEMQLFQVGLTLPLAALTACTAGCQLWQMLFAFVRTTEAYVFGNDRHSFDPCSPAVVPCTVTCKSRVSCWVPWQSEVINSTGSPRESSIRPTHRNEHCKRHNKKGIR